MVAYHQWAEDAIQRDVGKIYALQGHHVVHRILLLVLQGLH